MSKPILIIMSVLTGLTLLFGGMGVSGLGADNPTVALVGAWGTLATAAFSGAMGFYLANTNTANKQVVERADGGDVYAGEANELPTGQYVRGLN